MGLCDSRRSCRLSLQLVSTLVFLCFGERDVANGMRDGAGRTGSFPSGDIFSRRFPSFSPGYLS